nr:hypothetical protein [Morchella crassipes]
MKYKNYDGREKYFSLPNVSRVNITKGTMHYWLALFGIISFKDHRTVELEKFDKGVRYMEYVERRMRRLSETRNASTYFAVVRHVMSRSVVFFVWGMRSININWSRQYSPLKVIALFKSVGGEGDERVHGAPIPEGGPQEPSHRWEGGGSGGGEASPSPPLPPLASPPTTWWGGGKEEGGTPPLSSGPRGEGGGSGP